MTLSMPNTPAADAINITMSTANRFPEKGDGELPTWVPARNHGAVAAIDPHQTADAVVMTGMQTATNIAITPATLI